MSGSKFGRGFMCGEHGYSRKWDGRGSVLAAAALACVPQRQRYLFSSAARTRATVSAGVRETCATQRRDLLAGERLHVDLELVGFGEIGRILHRGIERAPQRLDARRRHVRRQKERAAV